MVLLKAAQCLRVHRLYSSNARLKSKSNELSSMEIRNTFINYFTEKHNHKFIRSSPVIPFCDPTVPFVNAGMNQFKNIFLGKATSSCNAAVNSQKCIRAGGKHNDLSLIGTDGYHHTFFEMLGNWSFGDYFKDKACRMAWDLLTNSYKIDSNRLYVTYFAGDAKLGLQPDLECKEIWQSIGVSNDRIIPFGVNENFWEMGATGPCGTCSEIHIDHLPNSDPTQRAKFVNAGLPDLTELWNVVFIEYNRQSDGTLQPLNEKFIDTGMGFERLVAALQGKTSNFDTDLFVPIFDAMSKISGKTAYSGTFNPTDPNYELDYAYRLVADHARMCSVCIADGMYPQTNNRLRKIMRKAMTICEQKFQTKNLIQTAIIPEIVQSLGSVYPELELHAKRIGYIFEAEDETHKALIEANRKNFKLLKLPATSNIKEEDVVDFSNFSLAFRDVERELKSRKNLKTLPTNFVYDKLYRTHGLNEELIQKLAAEKKVNVDMNEFEIYKTMKKQEAKSQHQIGKNALIERLTAANVPETIYHHMYDYAFDDKSRNFVVKPLTAKVAMVESNENEDLHQIVLDKTNFFHTAGGQDSDTGLIKSNESVFKVEDVNILNGYVVHAGRFLDGSKPFQPNEEVELTIDAGNRTHLSQHHTAMHLLQAAMKAITNGIVFQESSHVSASNLKCTFGVIGKRITLDQLSSIEELIRNVIRSNIPIGTALLDAHELYALNNLTTVPGATYPDNGVRVLKVIDAVNGFESIEPCCGTHASNTNQLEDFCFTSVKVTNSTSYNITAVAGRLVESYKLKEKNFLQTYEIFKQKMSSDDRSLDEWESMELEVGQIKQQLLTDNLPYITTKRVLAEIDILIKDIRTSIRAQVRQSIVQEIEDALAERTHFLVHVLETKNPLDDVLLLDAEQMCNDLPVILLNVSNDRIVSGRACIPQRYIDMIAEFTGAKFNAKDWLQGLVKPYKIKCSSKIKNDFNISTLKEIPDHTIEPLQLQDALEYTKHVAYEMFKKPFAADDKRRLVEVFQLNSNIQSIQSNLKKAKTVGDMRSLLKLVELLRSDVKSGSYNYELKTTSLAKLAEIGEHIIDVQHEMEIKLHMPGLEKTLSTASLNRKPFLFYLIGAHHHPLLRTVYRMTDSCENMALVLIVVSRHQVTGRISIPLSLSKGQLSAKEVSEEFTEKFEGVCIHHGTRYETSVADFNFNKDLVTEESLNEVLTRIESLFKNIS